MTAELSQVALEFARRCMGWDTPRVDGIGLFVYEPNSSSALLPEKSLSFTDPAAVIEAVRNWVAPQDRSLGLYHQLPLAFERWLWSDDNIESLCRNLMSACVEAVKRLEAA